MYSTEYTLNIKHLTLLKKDKSELRLIKTMASKWEDVGSLLDLREETLEIIKEDRHGNCYKCCRQVMKTWLDDCNSADYPVKWESILKLLHDLELPNTAYELEKILF